MTASQTTSRRTADTAVVLLGVALGLAFAVPALRYLVLLVAVSVVLVVAYLREHWLAVVLTVAFLARLLALAVDTQLGFVVVTGTSIENHQAFAAFADGLTRAELVLSPNVRRVILGVLYLPFYLALGGQYAVGAIATAFYGVLLGIPVYYIVREFGDRRAGLAATGAVLFWPSVFFRSLIVQREIIILLSLFLLLYVAIQWVTRIRSRDVVVALPALWVLFELRAENILFVAILGVLVILARGKFDAVTVVLFALGSAVAVFFALNFGQLTNYGTTITPASIDAFAHGRAHGRAVYFVNVHYRSWLDIVLLAPVKLVYYMFSPLPWQVEQVIDLLAGVSGWGVFLCSLLVPHVFRQYPEHRRKLFVLVTYALVGAMLYGIIEMNYGAAFRRRIAFVSIVVMLAACVLSEVRVTWEGRRTETQTTTETTPE